MTTKPFTVSTVQDGYVHLSAPDHGWFARVVAEVDDGDANANKVCAERIALLASAPVLQAQLAEATALLRVLADASPRNAQARWDARDKARAFLARLGGAK